METSSPELLFGIPIHEWIVRTANRMASAGVEDRKSWNRYWEEEYAELKGKSATCGSKPCPRAAAYGLWFLGFLRETKREQLRWPVPKVRERLGKNAAYAVIALELARESGLSKAELWERARSRFREVTGEEPAVSDQGELKVAIAVLSSISGRVYE